ncbi:hypothetical protein GLOTRDRAFT_128736 [Gloeophyllum trabeum ATCC 11539]|uniref:Uncharacterized protein n=1 Tax=Gloeophyllum trabeum (strain ATCC 11539 / FP-39264 / Madison 617) TaxID=670483 RepID=S7RM80_GLOTA|nr:uncharacterized protein GLOTRDRAFT_128736 [Gloeophyllum trabeum ATCC 11539]EPQ55505.1 hypothetical protein GLOTRDRAFT_128736 [Gloeophyllum trabeum ATCC 11539]
MSMHLRRTHDLLTSQPPRHPDPSALSQYESFPSPSDYARFRRQPLPLGASHPLSVTPAPLSIQPAHAHASVSSHPSRPPVRPSPLLVLASHSMVPSGPFSVRSEPARAPPDQSRYGPVRAISSSSAPLHRECPLWPSPSPEEETAPTTASISTFLRLHTLESRQPTEEAAATTTSAGWGSSCRFLSVQPPRTGLPACICASPVPAPDTNPNSRNLRLSRAVLASLRPRGRISIPVRSLVPTLYPYCVSQLPQPDACPVRPVYLCRRYACLSALVSSRPSTPTSHLRTPDGAPTPRLESPRLCTPREGAAHAVPRRLFAEGGARPALILLRTRTALLPCVFPPPHALSSPPRDPAATIPRACLSPIARALVPPADILQPQSQPSTCSGAGTRRLARSSEDGGHGSMAVPAAVF